MITDTGINELISWQGWHWKQALKDDIIHLIFSALLTFCENTSLTGGMISLMASIVELDIFVVVIPDELWTNSQFFSNLSCHDACVILLSLQWTWWILCQLSLVTWQITVVIIGKRFPNKWQFLWNMIHWSYLTDVYWRMWWIELMRLGWCEWNVTPVLPQRCYVFLAEPINPLSPATDIKIPKNMILNDNFYQYILLIFN